MMFGQGLGVFSWDMIKGFENYTEVGSGIEGANVYSRYYPPVMEETRTDTSCDEAMLSLD